MKRETTISKIETKNHKKSNICVGLSLALSVFIIGIFLVLTIFYKFYNDLESFIYVLLVFIVGICGTGYLPLAIGFQQPYFEIYQNKFTPVLIGIRDFLKKNKVFVFYSKIKRVELEEDPTHRVQMNGEFEPLRILLLYVINGNCVEVTNSQVPTDIINKLIETLKDYFEKEKIGVEWSNTVSTLMPRYRHCKRIKERYRE